MQLLYLMSIWTVSEIYSVNNVNASYSQCKLNLSNRHPSPKSSPSSLPSLIHFAIISSSSAHIQTSIYSSIIPYLDRVYCSLENGLPVNLLLLSRLTWILQCGIHPPRSVVLSLDNLLCWEMQTGITISNGCVSQKAAYQLHSGDAACPSVAGVHTDCSGICCDRNRHFGRRLHQVNVRGSRVGLVTFVTYHLLQAAQLKVL